MSARELIQMLHKNGAVILDPSDVELEYLTRYPAPTFKVAMTFKVDNKKQVVSGHSATIAEAVVKKNTLMIHPLYIGREIVCWTISKEIERNGLTEEEIVLSHHYGEPH